MIACAVFAGLNPNIESFKDFWPSGLFALAAATLLLPDTNFAQRIQLGLLLLIGVGLLWLGMSRGAVVNWSGVLSQNTGLLAMIMSVGMLKLVIAKPSEAQAIQNEKLPIGRKAFGQTLLSVTLFGSIINISAPILISDRLTLNRPMDYFTAGTLVRAYSGCAAFSPFFGCMAVAITAVGEFDLFSVMANGLPLTIASVVVLYMSASWFHPKKLDAFYGYPMRIESLFVPFLLTVIVFLSNMLFPTVPVLTIIALSSIVLTVTLLLFRFGITRTLERLVAFIRVDLPRTVNELQLFISAGILASGLQAMVQTGTLSAPITEFNSVSASILLALMILIAAMGIHPVIPIAALTPLILVTNPDPELLGLTYLFSWALGTQASPLSGTNLIMQGRYNIVAWRGAVQNWPFVAFMYWIAVLLLFVRGWIG